MRRVTQRWTWRRWQLVRVAEEDGEVILDAIELLAEPPFDGGVGPITIRFRDRVMPTGRDETLRAQLQRWRDREDGLCDVFQHAEDPFAVFAIFQGGDSVIASVHGDEGPV